MKDNQPHLCIKGEKMQVGFLQHTVATQMIFGVLYNLVFNPQNSHSLEFQLWVLLSELGIFTVQLDQTLWKYSVSQMPCGAHT